MKKKFILKDNFLISFFILIFTSFAIITAMSLLFAVIATFMRDPTGSIQLLSLISLVISALINGFLVAKIKPKASIGLYIGFSLVCILIMLTICLISCGGKVPASAFMNYCCYLGISTFTSLITAKKGGKRKKHK